MLAEPLMLKLRQSAPGIDIVIQPWHGTDASIAALMSSDTDLATALFDRDVDGLERRQVLYETYVVAMRHDHPAAASFDLDAWLAWPHVLVSGRGDQRSTLDAALGAYERKRRVGLVVPFFHMVPELIAKTDLIAMLPSHSIPPGLRDALAVFEPPIPIEGFALHLAWHMRTATDPAIRHVADIVAQLFAEDAF
jgi:DNA-binding transcriptional LysR family regulator